MHVSFWLVLLSHFYTLYLFFTRTNKNTGQKEEGAYIPVDLNDPMGGAKWHNFIRIVPDWKVHLYTGDYDLHEAYSAAGGMMGGQIAEATKEKVQLLNRLNAGIAEVDEKRTGKFNLKEGMIHKDEESKVDSEYAMFQHGDQATYRMNQQLEASIKKENQATLVRVVALQSDEPMGWC